MISQTERDMTNHFTARLRRLVTDTADTCQHAKLSKRNTAELMLVVLLSETVTAMIASGYSEERFIEVSRFAYKDLAVKLQPILHAARRSAAKK